MTTEQQRAEFEVYARNKNYDLDAVMLLSKPPKFSRYANPATQDSWEAYQAGRAALQSQEYTASIGHAGQTYLDQFKNAHALPAEFRWSELWAVMCIAANKGRTDALQSQDREDVGMAEIVREAAQIIAAIPPEHAPDNIRWPIVDELEGFASKIDHARRIEGDEECSKYTAT